jgi:ribosomal protein L32
MSIRMRHTRGHTNNRRSHHALVATTVVKDSASGNLRLPHRLDEVTGMYRGKQIALPKKVKKVSQKMKGASTEPVAPHLHDHAHEHDNAEIKATASKAKGTPRATKARSGLEG